MKPVIYIVGPTASGKTGLSIALAKRFGGEIISGDSMQIYKGMHIASAAPDEAEKDNVPHHLFEFLDASEDFSVAKYTELAGKVIDDIHKKSKLPFLVGGTGLYISSLSENLDFGIDNDDKSLRLKLEEQIASQGLETMYTYLKSIDPQSAEKISPNDKKRILRAIEVYKLSGVTMTQRIAQSKNKGAKYRNLFIGLTYNDRQLLYDRINKRVDIMVEKGLLDEARSAYGKIGGTAAQAIGHKELFPFFKGEMTLDEALEHLKMQTRRYAKRQMTWFRKNENINWIYMDEDVDPLLTAEKLIEEFI